MIEVHSTRGAGGQPFLDATWMINIQIQAI